MPYWVRFAPAGCHMTMAALPLANSCSASVPLVFSASDGLTILSDAIRFMISVIVAMFCGVTKVGLPRSRTRSRPAAR